MKFDKQEFKDHIIHLGDILKGKKTQINGFIPKKSYMLEMIRQEAQAYRLCLRYELEKIDIDQLMNW